MAGKAFSLVFQQIGPYLDPSCPLVRLISTILHSVLHSLLTVFTVEDRYSRTARESQKRGQQGKDTRDRTSGSGHPGTGHPGQLVHPEHDILERTGNRDMTVGIGQDVLLILPHWLNFHALCFIGLNSFQNISAHRRMLIF